MRAPVVGVVDIDAQHSFEVATVEDQADASPGSLQVDAGRDKPRAAHASFAVPNSPLSEDAAG